MTASRPGPLLPSSRADLPCDRCSSLCCRYYALQIDTPTTVEDFDAIRWYVMHDTSWVWVDDGDWYLQVEQPCMQLGPAGECLIYATRPSICRDYGLPQQDEAPDEPPCDYFTRGGTHDLEFHTPAEVERHVAEYQATREAARRRRSEAARRGWATRRARSTRIPGGPRRR